MADACGREGLSSRQVYCQGVITLSTTTTDAARARAEAQFKKKEQQAREGEQARAEYEATQRAVRENTARLRALRLAREAAARQAPTTAKKTG
jgi:hypothetical protein